MSVRILIGDMRERLKELADASIDSCVTDPPHHLASIVKRWSGATENNAKVGATGAYHRATKGFMGQTWDGGDVAFDPATWAEVYRVLKPGAHVVAFSGTRTYHRMACAIEDAGFDIRDQLAWIYGSGFPKSHNLSGAHEGWGSALKPAWEPICLARKPLVGTIAGNMALHGTGAINIDGCRIFTEDELRAGSGGIPARHDVDTPRKTYTVKRLKPGATLDKTGGNWRPEGDDAVLYHGESKPGRWPANILHDGSDEVVAAFPQTKSGEFLPHHQARGKSQIGTFDIRDRTGETHPTYGDEGSAARFFYTAKASKADRGEGNSHPTVKPVDLMRWLCRLVTPLSGTVLDPFAGSGSTLIAADAEQFHAIGCELSPEYAALAERRVRDSAGMFAEVEAA